MENIIKVVDDYLILTSFVSRERTFYYKWQLSFRDYIITLYRGNYSYPEKIEYKQNEGLVITPKYRLFINQTFLKYLEINKTKSIRYAIHYLTNEYIGTIETKFLSYFAGIETILDLFKKNHNLGKILSKSKKQKIEKILKDCIQECEFVDDNQKKAIYRKLPELNRNSIQYIYDEFCKKYSINNDDLWPMFNNEKYISLSKIRNSLIHGGTIPRGYLKFMILATENLKYVLERFILALIGWNISESNIIFLENNEKLNCYMSKLTELFEGIKDF